MNPLIQPAARLPDVSDLAPTDPTYPLTASPEGQSDEASAQPPKPLWGWFRRWAFRFGLIYVVLYVLQDQMHLPFSLVARVAGVVAQIEQPDDETAKEKEEPANAFDKAWETVADSARSVGGAMSAAQEWVDQAWEDTVGFVTNTILREETKVEDKPSGSGDTTFDHLSMRTIAILAMLGSVVWSLLDRRPRRHWRLLAGLSIVIRYELAVTMLVYGFIKMFPLQFSGPYPYRMDQAFGDASPMGLLWTFMGASPTYTSITGTIEVLGGVLLLSRRTTTLGAMVTAGAMGNIAALNYCYDVPVKLLSTHMCAFSLILLGLEWQRLVDFFILNRSAAARRLRTPFTGAWWPALTYPIKIVIVFALLYSGVVEHIDAMKIYGPDRPRPELYGFYQVEKFERDGELIPPLLSDQSRWNNMIIDGRGGITTARVKTMTRDTLYYEIKPDAETKKITIAAGYGENKGPEFVLDYEQPSAKAFVLRGELQGHTVVITMTKKSEEDFMLTSRGFHWVSEYPHNR